MQHYHTKPQSGLKEAMKTVTKFEMTVQISTKMHML